MKVHRLLGILVLHGKIFAVHSNFHPEFLANLPLERGGERLAGFHFPAGEFPEAREVDIVGALRDENLIVAANDRRDDCEKCGHVNYVAESPSFLYGRKSSKHSLRRRKSIKRR